MHTSQLHTNLLFCGGGGSLVFRILIRIQFGQLIQIQEGKDDHQKKKTVKKFHVCCFMFLLGGWRLLL
jgi:hypothetical protein